MTRIILWHPDDELSKVIELKQFEAHSDIVVDVAFNDAHNLLASFSYYTDDRVRLWNDQTGEQVASIDVWSESIEFSPNGDLLATDSVDHLVKLWSVDKTLEEKSLGPGDEQAIFQGHTDDVELVAFSPNGQYLASVSYDWTLRIWNIDTELEEFVISLSDIASFE
jgi:WD40 repeat protein